MFVWTCTGGGTHQPIGYNGPGDKCPVCQEKQEADRRVSVAQEKIIELEGVVAGLHANLEAQTFYE